MYSVVLMMALAQGGDLPACHRAAYNCSGCYGGYYNGYYAAGWESRLIVVVADRREVITEVRTDQSPKAAPATIVVRLPADAKLTIDDAATASTSARRVFTSPDLPAGREFHYTLKAEWTRDGKPVAISRQIAVRAGEETDLTLEADAAVAAGEYAPRPRERTSP